MVGVGRKGWEGNICGGRRVSSLFEENARKG